MRGGWREGREGEDDDRIEGSCDDLMRGGCRERMEGEGDNRIEGSYIWVKFTWGDIPPGIFLTGCDDFIKEVEGGKLGDDYNRIEES